MTPTPIHCPFGAEPQGGMLVPEETVRRILAGFEAGAGPSTWPRVEPAIVIEPRDNREPIVAVSDRAIVDGREVVIPLQRPIPVRLGDPEKRAEFHRQLIADLESTVRAREDTIVLLRSECEVIRRERDALVQGAKDWRTA
jgi:hypothetical protein